jgi:hypothetical protein
VIIFAIYIDSVPTVHYSNINGIITVEYSKNALTHLWVYDDSEAQ